MYFLILSLIASVVATPSCRFARNYTTASILSNPNPIASDLLYWEGKFHADNVSYNAATGLSYDGTLLDPTTGVHTAGHPFSAASKESLQIMIYAQALNGNKDAARFLSPNDPGLAKTIAFNIMKTKLQTYLTFNQTYPGFGGYLPWFLQTVNGNSTTVSPTADWVNRVPALDNGENIWAIYAAVEALSSGNAQYKSLAMGWQAYLDYLKVNAVKVFYRGNGTVCAVTTLNQSLAVNDPKQSYKCEGNATLNDPYEGELFAWWLYFFGNLSRTEQEAIWVVKRPQLVRVDYNSTRYPPITVQKGFWFSSHENWKFMEMPYLDVPLIKRIYMNNERARTCNSVVTKNPGMFASINNSTDANGQIIGYISNCGIPSIANQTVQELDVITPYSVFPLMLVNRTLGLVWWHNIVSGKKMQNPYGSTESTRIDGTAISSFVSWDSKITTVNALLGGVQSIVSRKMKADGIYDAFIRRITSEYQMKFSGNLSGENVSICLPSNSVPDTGLQDYTTCQ